MHWIQFFGGMFLGILVGFLMSAFLLAVGTEDREYEKAVRQYLADMERRAEKHDE